MNWKEWSFAVAGWLPSPVNRLALVQGALETDCSHLKDVKVEGFHRNLSVIKLMKSN